MNWERAGFGFNQSFWSDVAAYISSPVDWVNFSRTCMFFASIARLWMPVKKGAFRVTFQEWFKGELKDRFKHKPLCKIPCVLPNGAVHCSVSSAPLIFEQYDTGRLITFLVKGEEMPTQDVHVFVTRHLYFTTDATSVYFANFITGSDVGPRRCGFCNKYHHFLLTCETMQVFMSRTCLEKTYKMFSTRVFSLRDFHRRQSVKRKIRGILRKRTEIAALLK